ncbi:MAG: SMI1/KNR4 family protein [Alcaligenaceae bacterium]|nr:MAG: SMI1/KNR4 family protein [Alcaligenaceae bacterium]
MKEIFRLLCQSRITDNEINLHPELVEGYTEEELVKIERLYDVSFSGDLRDFMLEMGRSDGGLLGDDPICLYSTRSVRRHIFFQAGMDDRFFAMKKFDLRSKGSFIFSVESETQYHFLLTKSDEPDLVYRYNEDFADESDPAAMTSTGMTFMDYMHRAVRVYTDRMYTELRSGVVCRGEMIVI